tara:strand:- start:262 stop:864 length:603 start_codon:yes stop_codon:yes gene_type:complete
MAINFMAVQELVRQYNDDPRMFSDQEAEMISGLAGSFGLNFQRTSKPLEKAAFDFADMATLGLIPNDWRPQARGDFYLGESDRDQLAGGVGTLGGLVGAAGVGIKGARALFGKGGGGGSITAKAAEGVSKSPRGLLPPYEGGLVPSPRLLGPGSPPPVSSPLQLGPASLLSMAGSGPTQIPRFAASRYNTVQRGFQQQYP